MTATKLTYLGLMLAGLLIAGLNQQIGAGNVPLPAGWGWIAAVISPALVLLAATLEKWGSEDGTAP